MDSGTCGRWSVRWSAAGVLLAALVMLVGSLVTPGSASAAPGTQTSMSQWTDGEVWQTSTGWGRVRERVGFEWTLSAPYQVRAITQVQVDWRSGCTTSLSASKEAPVTLENCSNEWAWKRQVLKLKSMSVPMTWSGPSGSGKQTCNWGALSAEGPVAKTWTCRGAWVDEVDSKPYRVAVGTINGDVKDDGDGLKPVAGQSYTLTFTPQ